MDFFFNSFNLYHNYFSPNNFNNNMKDTNFMTCMR